ncbi:MAG: phosphatidylglycerophosphatase A [Alphaproteobacteria bacterium]|nr:phosphatidylglycerophosphatase A [Alphaproteobacteria bacterium]
MMANIKHLKTIKHHCYVLIATFFYSGLLRPAPGTWGSLAAVMVSLLLLMFVSPIMLIHVAVILFIIGLPATKYYGEITGIVDNGEIVIDEAVAIMLIFGCLDLFSELSLPVFAVAAFILFRLFDIAKPIPISYFDKKLKNAFGVMFDDILAAIYSIIGLKFMVWGINVY